MSPTLYSCVICGYLIDGYANSSWLKEFRAVYSGSEGVFVTGVGRYVDPGGGDWIAPSDPTMRWDNQGYDYPPRDIIPVMKQGPQNGRHGFVLHDSCWHLLRKFFEPDDVPIERLLSICKSLPFPIRGIGVYWGHNYGGLINFDEENHYLWEDSLTEVYNSSETHATQNPYDIDEIAGLLTSTKSSNPTPEISPMTPENDCFAKLPWELLEAISINLLVPDVLSLVRASKSFRPILTSQTFWASRFEPGRDRDFVFEKRNSKEARDWKALYQLTSRASSQPGLKNRRRIWELIRASAPSLRSNLDEKMESSGLNIGISDSEWYEAAGEVQPEEIRDRPAVFYSGCMLFQKQKAIIPYGLSRIAFSTRGNCVTGIRLISKDTDVAFGYINRGDESFLEVVSICGLVLAIGSQGVQAVRVLDNSGDASRWYGNPKDAPVTERLTGFEAITALGVGIDGYKIISIAVAGQRKSSFDKSLRTTALWYPSVPNQDMYLNDESFTGENPLNTVYQPLILIHFGGSKGIYLQSITAISVTRLGNICCIEFEYNTEDIPKDIRKLGRRKLTEFSHVTRFPIDGPAGEFINAIAVSIQRSDSESAYSFYKHGCLDSLKVGRDFP
ncbi:hypothetical protein FQN50_006037 [Emmonsiellopsis sp. PD_5]|nr:hypothetical protein FQN50_006037 [Emmonsiellopsis sp. PD_5]